MVKLLGAHMIKMNAGLYRFIWSAGLSAGVVCGSALCPIHLAAQADSLSAGVVAGGLVPLGDIYNFARSGWHIGGLAAFPTPVHLLGVRVEGMYGRFGRKYHSTPSVIAGMLDAVLTLPRNGSSLRLYLIGGGGMYKERLGSGYTETHGGVNAGAGILVGRTNFNPFVEARWHYVFDKSGIADAPSVPHMEFIPVSVGILFR